MSKPSETRTVGGFTIERNVPIPTAEKRPVGRPSTYPWAAMKPNESVLIKPNGKAHKPHSVAMSARTFGKRHKQTFLVVKVSGGVRVWRQR